MTHQMKRKRRNHSSEFKAKIAFAALCGNQTVAEIAREHQLHAHASNRVEKAPARADGIGIRDEAGGH